MRSIQLGSWSIKASALDDQILILGYKKDTVDSFVAMFYNENEAFTFMEKIYDQDSKTRVR